MKRSAGFTLTELLITMVVMALLGSALARMLINNSRFVSRQDAMLSARESARAAMNTMLAELRLVSDGGLRAASRDSVRARIPIAFGMLCGTSGGTTIASLLPYDSVMYAAATLDSLAWLDSVGTYNAVGGITVASSTAEAACSADSIRVIPGGRLVSLSRPNVGEPGRLFYLYQTVTYRFGSSTEMPGRRALWRRPGGERAEEIVAPFDTAASFRFLVGARLTPTATPPAVLDSVRGLELRLIGASDYTPQGLTAFQTFDLSTHVAFLNRR
jgi:prepilin-type N-terminal cleavage/methylation domain-containing protein